MTEQDEKALWVEEKMAWLEANGYRITSSTQAWLEEYYDGRDPILKDRERQARDLERQLREAPCETPASRRQPSGSRMPTTPKSRSSR